MKDFGVNLTGGGARGSYQAGVLKGIAEVLKEQNLLGKDNPFRFWSGVSAGAINATGCASGLANLDVTIDKLAHLWARIQPENVYRTDFMALTGNGFRWLHDLTLGSISSNQKAKSLLDTKPLWSYLRSNLNFDGIQANIDSGLLGGLACSAYSYSENCTVTFLQSDHDCSWRRHKRYSVQMKIQLEHIMASCAIPMLFPAIHMGPYYYADGSFRNMTPISPVIHMGAKKILVVGVRGKDEFSDKTYTREPGIAKIGGAILNSLFFDTVDIDLERLRHINELVEASQQSNILTNRSEYSKIEYHVIRPSRDISRMAADKVKSFPKLINFLMGGLGPISESAELASYILFVPEFTKDLIELGYNDVINQKSNLLKWMESP